jgi:hypothetical protein
MKKRDRYFAKLDEYREHFRTLSSEYLRRQLPRMSIKEAVAAARAVLQERSESPGSLESNAGDNSGDDDQFNAPSL